MDRDSLSQELKELEAKLSDTEFIKDYKRIAGASKRMAEIERTLNADHPTSSGSTITEVIVEIRAGTGGDEGTLFAATLFEMYQRYAELKGWGCKIVDENRTSLGGFKQIVFELEGNGVVEAMK